MNKPDGRIKRGRPKRRRWMDCTERDLRILGMINWRSMVFRRYEWKKFPWQAKTREGL